MRISRLLVVPLALGGCRSAAPEPAAAALSTPPVRMFLTSSAGDHMREISSAHSSGEPSAHIRVVRDRPRQVFFGVGGSLTQASAAALKTLTPEKRREVLEAYFGEDGARYSLSRIHIASSDFSEYSYTYSPAPGVFSIEEDQKNGLIALIRDAQSVPGSSFRIVASPWTAPPWMKDNGKYYDPKERRGGRLLEEHRGAFADYLVKYIRAYASQGIPIWAITPVNEPQGNNGSWESMDMPPEEQSEVVSIIGDAFRAASLDTRILIFDQNRAEMPEYTKVILGDPETARHVFGTAVHWYNSTFRVYEDVLDAQHALYPDKVIIQTEGTADSLANPASCDGTCRVRPCGCEGLYDWWQDDGWFWREEATDWGWDWSNHPEDHPKYAPAMRYARDLVVSVGHWMAGWIDWNIALNKRGGPNHVENYCLAPVLVDGETDTVYYTPIYYVLAQFSRHSRPGGMVLTTEVEGPEGLVGTAIENPDGTVAVHVFNESGGEVPYRVELGARAVNVTIPDAALLTTVFVDG